MTNFQAYFNNNNKSLKIFLTTSSPLHVCMQGQKGSEEQRAAVTHRRKRGRTRKTPSLSQQTAQIPTPARYNCQGTSAMLHVQQQMYPDKKAHWFYSFGHLTRQRFNGVEEGRMGNGRKGGYCRKRQGRRYKTRQPPHTKFLQIVAYRLSVIFLTTAISNYVQPNNWPPASQQRHSKEQHCSLHYT